MTSSVDSIRPDDGGRAGARTPTGAAQTSAAGVDVSELSPPGSQTRQEATAPISGIGTTLEGRGGQAADRTSEPMIAAWKSKRAQEDYQRAAEFVIDKDFSLSMWFLMSTWTRFTLWFLLKRCANWLLCSQRNSETHLMNVT